MFALLSVGVEVPVHVEEHVGVVVAQGHDHLRTRLERGRSVDVNAQPTISYTGYNNTTLAANQHYTESTHNGHDHLRTRLERGRSVEVNAQPAISYTGYNNTLGTAD